MDVSENRLPETKNNFSYYDILQPTPPLSLSVPSCSLVITNTVAGVISLSAHSADYTTLTLCRTTESSDLLHPIDCLYFADNVIIVTDCISVEDMTGD